MYHMDQKFNKRKQVWDKACIAPLKKLEHDNEII
jgi:hypothetical protein